MESVAEGGQYLALTGLHGGVTLYNRQTEARESIAPPDCSEGYSGAGFGGPWLVFACPAAEGGPALDLFDLASGTWSLASISSQGCDPTLGTACEVGGIGSTWIRLFQSNGLAHATYTWCLQTSRLVKSSLTPLMRLSHQFKTTWIRLPASGPPAPSCRLLRSPRSTADPPAR